MKYTDLSVKICPECGMLYVSGVRKDESAHRKHHERAVNGWPVTARQRFQRVIFEQENVGIVEFVHNDGRASDGLVVTEVAKLAKKTLGPRAGLAWPGYGAEVMLDVRDDYRSYLYRIDNRIVGLAVLSRSASALQGRWDGTPVGPAASESRWGVEFVWVATGWRRQGLARRLLVEAASHLLTAPHHFVWSSPFSETGMALVRYFCPEQYLYW